MHFSIIRQPPRVEETLHLSPAIAHVTAVLPVPSSDAFMSAPRASEIRTPSASALAAASKSAASSAARSVRRRARVCVAMSGEIVVQVRKSVQSIEGEEGGVVVVVVRWWYRKYKLFGFGEAVPRKIACG